MEVLGGEVVLEVDVTCWFFKAEDSMNGFVGI